MIKKKWALWSEKKELDTATVALKFMSSKKVMEICVAMLEKMNSKIYVWFMSFGQSV